MTFRPALAAVLLCAMAAAQDTRKVTEPRLPPACTVVQAQLPESIPESDETKLDTERIQRAIDSCAKGQGVVLAPELIDPRFADPDSDGNVNGG